MDEIESEQDMPFCPTCGYPCGRIELEELKVKVRELNDELTRLRMEAQHAPF